MADIHGMKWIDTDGTVRGFKNVDGQPRIVSQAYYQQIAEGNVTGHSIFLKNGYNGDIGLTAETAWSYSNVRPTPTGNMQMRIISSSASDTSAGTGIQQVRLYYLDSTFVEHTEDITMNGTTPVNTIASNIYRVQHLKALTVGTNLRAVGDIDLQNTTGTTTYERIPSGFGRDRTAAYTVPFGKNLFLTSLRASSGSGAKLATVRISLTANCDSITGNLINIFETWAETILQDASFYIPLEIPFKFPAGTDIAVGVLSTVAGASCSCSLSGWEETA